MATIATERLARILIVIGAVILIVGALLHLFGGYPHISKALFESNLKRLHATIFQVLWVMFSVHWILAATIALVALFSAGPRRRIFVVLAAAIPLLDAIPLIVKMGLFLGDIVLGLSGILLVLGAALLPAKS